MKDRLEVPRLGRRAVGRALAAVVLLAGTAAVAVVLLRPPTVTVAEVGLREIAPAIQGVGTVEAKVVVQVAPKVAGRLITVLVDQGDRVGIGQVLARLDDTQARADLARSEAALAVADAQLRDLLAGARTEELAEAEANVARAQAQLDDLIVGARPEELEELAERLASAQATRRLAERELGRAAELHARQFIATQDLDRARQAYEVAGAQERALGQSLALARTGARAHQIDAGRAQLRAAVERLALLRAGPRAHQADAARAQVREARAAVASAQSRLDDAVIASPLEGEVISRELETGATVNPGTPVLRVFDPRTAWVTVHVDGREIGPVAVGHPARITLRSLPGRTLEGRVARIRREGDRVTEQLAVDVTFVERPPRVTLGEQAEATLQPAGHRGPAVPLAALVRSASGLGVLAVEDGRLVARPVRVGLADPAGWTEVLDGVRPGERVVVAPGRLAEARHAGRRVLTQPFAAGDGAAWRSAAAPVSR